MLRPTSLAIALLLLSSTSIAQEQAGSCDFLRPQHCAVDVVRDQAAIWSSPARMPAGSAISAIGWALL